MRNTPPVYVRGQFDLRTPWTVQASTIYTCIAVRSFEDIYERNIDVFTEFYEPKGLTSTEFDADKAEGATIVTLISEDDEIIYVPDTYINSYPNMSDIPYNRVIVSIDLGTLPETLDLSALQTNLAGVTEESIGVVPDIKYHIAASTDAVSASDHTTLEAARQAAIDALGVTPATATAKLKKQEQVNSALNQKIATLEQIVKDNNLI